MLLLIFVIYSKILTDEKPRHAAMRSLPGFLPEAAARILPGFLPEAPARSLPVFAGTSGFGFGEQKDISSS